MLLTSNLSTEGNARLFSGSAALLILFVKEAFSILYGEHYGVFSSMVVFLCYLITDTFARNTNLPTDAAFHHGAGGFIVLFGMYKMNSSLVFHSCITPYLYMEATTPFLHGAWILHNETKYMNKDVAKILFVFLLFLWVPFRLYYPTLTTLHLFFNSNLHLPLSSTEINIGKPFFISFCALQYYWFGKLIERLLHK